MKFAILSFLIIFVSGCSDHREYCESLKELANSETASAVILEWVRLNVGDNSTQHQNMQGTVGLIPGDYKILNDNLDWSKLGFENAGQINIIGKPSFIDALLISERSRYGILVNISGAKQFGLPDHQAGYIHTSERAEVGTLCMETG